MSTPPRGLHASLRWEPYRHVGDGYKVEGYRREDGAGYVLPVFDMRGWKVTDEWWATWAHPMMCGRPGWHHHALGTYGSAEAGAMAFDSVYELERIAGNKDRMIGKVDASDEGARTNPDFKTVLKTPPLRTRNRNDFQRLRV